MSGCGFPESVALSELPGSTFRGRHRDLVTDISDILRKDITDVVCLLTEPEFRKFRVRTLLDKYEASGNLENLSRARVINYKMALLIFLFSANSYTIIPSRTSGISFSNRRWNGAYKCVLPKSPASENKKEDCRWKPSIDSLLW